VIAPQFNNDNIDKHDRGPVSLNIGEELGGVPGES
jgi:hypothetical protein